MITTALLVMALLVGGLLLYAANRADTFRVERHVVINRRPADIFPLLEDFHRWAEWSPWEDLDPALLRTYRGADRGKGAIYEWEGNRKVGKGHMEITRIDSPTHLTIDLSFVRPFKAENAAAFDLEPQGAGTEVTWAMYGPLPFASKLMSMFVSMDAMIGKDFERGLAKLKAVAERSAAPA
jgi:hypothetical protein